MHNSQGGVHALDTAMKCGKNYPQGRRASTESKGAASACDPSAREVGTGGSPGATGLASLA